MGAVYPVESPDESDDFSGNTLGLQWQWNANHSKGWYQMEQPGLRLYAQKYEEHSANAPPPAAAEMDCAFLYSTGKDPGTGFKRR